MDQKNQGQNILVVLPNPMGDAILCIPALRCLRQGLPDGRFTFYANKVVAEILADCPWTDAWLSYDPRTGADGIWAQARILRRRHFEAAIILTNSFRSALLAFLAGISRRIGYSRDGRGILLTDRVAPVRLQGRFAPISMLDYYDHLAAKAVGFLGGVYQQQDHRLELFVSAEARRRVDELWDRWQIAPDQKPVVMVPGGSFGASKWWPAPRFAELADRLVESDNCRIILSCAPGATEKEIARQIAVNAQHPVISLAEENLRLTDLKELIRRCRLMIGNDTGPCHIAAAFNVPLVTIFGPTDPRWTATGYEKEIRLRIDVDCGPCQQPVCPQKHHRCLNEITVEQVYAAAQKLLRHDDSSIWQTPVNAADLIGTYFSPFDESFAPLPEGGGLVHRGYEKVLQPAQLTDCAGVFAYDKGRRLDKPGLKARERLCLKLPADQGQNVTLYLKRYGGCGFWSLWRRWVVRRSRRAAAVYDFDAAMTLAQKGIPVARPIALGQQANWPGEKRSFVMIEELPHADALERLLPCRAEKQKEYHLLKNKKELINEIALLVQKLHRFGFYHRDLYLSHIFLSRDKNGRERLNLIDLQRVFEPLLNRRRWQIKDLAQLYYSARDYFSDTDIMRFLHRYLSCRRLSPADKNLTRAILGKARRIARHDRKKKKTANRPEASATGNY